MKHFMLAVSCVVAAGLPVLAQTQPVRTQDKPVRTQDKKDSLVNLMQAGNRKAALDKIREGADVNEVQPDGTRPVHWAVYHVDYELLDALIAKKAKVDVTNEFGSTPLAQAAMVGDARMVKTLLAAGAGPEGVNQDGQTALMLAIKTGELPVVEMLVKAGANVNAVETFHNQTALMWAAVAPKNASAMVKLLLAKGADVKPRALYTDWPSQITSEPRAQYRPTGGLTALLYAARNGCYDCVDALIGAGADANGPTPEGVTPLMMALDNDHLDVAKLLLNRGASPGLWDWWGRTALYIVIDRKEGGSSGGLRLGAAAISARPERVVTAVNGISSMDIVNAILAAGVDPSPELNMHRPSRGGNSGRFIDPLLNTGCTPLLRATMANDMEVVQALLAKGASPNINDMGLTAFLVAAGVGTGTRGGTGLAAAASAGGAPNVALMDLLLQHRANVNDQVTGTKTYSMRIARSPSSNEGMTALHVAARAGRTEVVRYLLEKGANPEIADASGRKAIDLLDASAPGGGALARAGSVNPASSTQGGTPAAVASGAATPSTRQAGTAGARKAPGGDAASVAEIRALLANASKK